MNRELGDIYNSWYLFDVNGIPNSFDNNKQIKDAKNVLLLLDELIKEIKNADKNVIVEDHETSYYKEILESQSSF